MILEFLAFLSEIEDPRRPQGKKWQLGALLLATILAILSGATSYRKVHGYLKANRKKLNAAFGFGWKTAPAYSSVRHILQSLDADEIEQKFRTHSLQLSAAGDADSEQAIDIETMPVLAIDGKVLRHSFDAFNDKQAAHLLSVFAAGEALILGHLAIEDKSNEIPAAPQIIRELGLSGRLFTMDAMHCQKNIRSGT
jgi:hypothetical protein